jgi:prepilin-type N-terminal cleavage/methylation domain-containing protein
MNRSRRHGFSLIELIAVIIIIVVLAAIVIGRYGNVSHGARNAVIGSFLQDCSNIRASMMYGNSQNKFANTEFTPIQQYVSANGFGSTVATLDSTGNILTLEYLPPNLFKTHVTTLTIDFSHNTYNTLTKDQFLSLVQY